MGEGQSREDAVGEEDRLGRRLPQPQRPQVDRPRRASDKSGGRGDDAWELFFHDAKFNLVGLSK